MHAISPYMRKAALIRQDLGRPHVPTHLQAGRNRLIMTQPAFNSTSLSEGEMDLIQATAYVWRARGYTRTADNLLLVAGLTTAAPVQTPLSPGVWGPQEGDDYRACSPLPEGVYDLSAYRARRQAVTR